MTNGEALEILKTTSWLCSDKGIAMYKSVAAAIDALESKIPVKPTWESIGAYKAYICPSCKAHCVNDELYCAKCGQAIDWSDE